MSMKRHWATLSVWLLTSGIAALSCSLIKPAARLGSEYFPVGNDSFYHAARILEAVSDPAAFYQFDPKIHAPEGSLLVWPWGYDYLLAMLVRLCVAVGLSSDPLMVLLWIPVAAVAINVGLLILLARRLSLGVWPTALAALCMALSMNTQLLHGFGQIDHHYAELTFILASLVAGLAWFQAPTIRSGVTLGATFGAALLIHNGLFILQLPFLMAAFMRWRQGKGAPAQAVVALTGTLLSSALFALIPSLAFRQGLFEFYTLSWFHLYVICCTALVILYFAYKPATARNTLLLGVIGLLLLLPLIRQIGYAGSFVTGSLGMLHVINEMRSPLQLAVQGQADLLTGVYSFLFWLAPATIVVCLVWTWRERHSPRLLFWICCVLGMALLSFQLRLHYFGVVALYLPWLVLAQQFAEHRAELYKRTFLIVSLLLLLAYAPQLRHSLIEPVPTGADEWFAKLYPIFPALRKACDDDPGVVLADTNAGHYIRYFSSCSVITNNFLLTQQQFDKVEQAEHLFALPASALSSEAPYVKYVLVRPASITARQAGGFAYELFGLQEKPQLTETLLLGSSQSIPPEFHLIAEADIKLRDGAVTAVPYAKLYKIERDSAASSVIDVGE